MSQPLTQRARSTEAACTRETRQQRAVRLEACSSSCRVHTFQRWGCEERRHGRRRARKVHNGWHAAEGAWGRCPRPLCQRHARTRAHVHPHGALPAKGGELARRASNSLTNSLLLTPLCLAGRFWSVGRHRRGGRRKLQRRLLISDALGLARSPATGPYRLISAYGAWSG